MPAQCACSTRYSRLRWQWRAQGNSIHGRIDLEAMTVLIPNLGGRCPILSTWALEQVGSYRIWSNLALALVSPLQPHADSITGTQRNAMQKHDVLSGDEFEPIALRHGSDEEQNLCQRKLGADADARTGAERQIGEARPRRASLP
jgi:hypothetical protein